MVRCVGRVGRVEVLPQVRRVRVGSSHVAGCAAFHKTGDVQRTHSLVSTASRAPRAGLAPFEQVSLSNSAWPPPPPPPLPDPKGW